MPLGSRVRFQRGYDITRGAQRPGAVPVVSSGGVCSTHDTARAPGPGVVVGRKGSLGRVHYVDGPFWPHDTTLFVTDFGGCDPRWVAALMRSMSLARLDRGSANPTLNRADVHAQDVQFLGGVEQRRAGDLLRLLDARVAAGRRLARGLDALLRDRMAQRCGGAPRPLSDWVDVNPKEKLGLGDARSFLAMRGVPTTGGWCQLEPPKVGRGGARFRDGDVLLARISPCLENGKVGVVDGLGAGEVARGSTEFLVLRARPGVSRAFVYTVARSPGLLAYSVARRVGSSGRQRLGAEDLRAFPVCGPRASASDDGQADLERCLSRMLVAERQVAQWGRLRDALEGPVARGWMPSGCFAL